MSINVRLFASLREQFGKPDLSIEANTATNVQEVWNIISNGTSMQSNTLCAINMEYVELSHKVKDGDEVAFFPPVTGG